MMSAIQSERAGVKASRVRPKSMIRRHWLSGALILVACGISVYTMSHLYEAQHKLYEVRGAREDLELKLKEAEQKHRQLTNQYNNVTTNDAMELAAKSMGFVYPNETVFQMSPGQ